SAGQKQQARQERPEHQADRERERTVDFLKIQPRQGEDIGVFERLGKQSHDDGGGQHGAHRDLAIGQHPVNEEENGNAGGDGEQLHDDESDRAHEVLAVSAQQELDKRHRTGGQSDRQQGQDTAGEGQSERDHLISQVGAVFLEMPDPVQGNFQRQKYSGRSDQQNNQRCELHALPGVHHGVEVADDEVLARRKVVPQELNDNFAHHPGVKLAADQGHHQHDERKERQDGVGG